MSNYCAKHLQFYSEFCVYCGNPIHSVTTTSTINILCGAVIQSTIMGNITCANEKENCTLHNQLK